jgi:hypothetical protein
MKNKLILMLKTLFASKGFGQKTLEGIADILIAGNLTETSTQEEIDTAIAGVKPYVDIMQAENTRYANEVKSKLPKVEEVITEPVTVTTPAIAPSAEVPEWAKGFTTALETLSKGLTAMQTEKVTGSRKDQLAKLLAETPEAYRNKALKDFSRMKFETDEEFNDFITESETDAAEFIQGESNAGLGADARPRSTAVGKVTAEKEVSAEMKQYLADRAAEAPKTTV